MKCFRNQWNVITVSNIESLRAHFVFHFTLSPTGLKKLHIFFSDGFFWIAKKKYKFNIWKPEQTLSEKHNLIDPVSNCKLKWKSKVSANIVICKQRMSENSDTHHTSPIVINAPIRGILTATTKNSFLLWLAKFKYQKTCFVNSEYRYWVRKKQHEARPQLFSYHSHTLSRILLHSELRN